MKKFTYMLFVALSILAMNSCSSDADMSLTDKVQNSAHNHRFVINVTKNDGTSTRSEKKTEWEEGDVIYARCKDFNFKLTYKPDRYEGGWELSDPDIFFEKKDSDSRIFAYHSVYYQYDNPPHAFLYEPGTVLYTDKGEYTCEEDVVYINLDMKRPYAMVTVNGIEPWGKWKIAGLMRYDFDKDERALKPYDYNECSGHRGDSTAIYYGIISSTNNQTRILLYNYDVGYSRTYDKVMEGGASIVLNGPKSSEANLWTKLKLVTSIGLNKYSIDTYLDKTFDLEATMSPEDADNRELKWTSSDTSVATVDDNGHVKIVGIGYAEIRASTKDGSCTSSSCEIRSAY